MFCYTSQLKSTKKKHYLLEAGWHANLPRFQCAQPSLVRDQSLSCCFPKDLVSFVRSIELVSFDPRHVTRLDELGRACITKGFNSPMAGNLITDVSLFIF